ncbi:hypothetical protein BH09PAT2_BH09PAT2_10820 [soil metagenome]
MKKIILFTITILFIPLLSPVMAHTLKIDGNIGITLHIDPDDEPLAGKEAKILFDIQDKSHQFDSANPSNCNCFLEIKDSSKSLEKLSLVAGNTYSQLRYTFPYGGKYTFIVTGKWDGQGVPFTPFSASYDYYVLPQQGQSKQAQNDRNTLKDYLPFVIVMGIGSISLLFLLPATLTIKNGKENE